jgi:hypothetical protein
MEKRLVIIAAACALWAAPALAGQADIGSPYGSDHANREHNRDLESMKGGMKGNLGEPKTYGYEREGDYRRHGEGEWRYHHGEAMREGCKYITVRQRQGEEIVVRHFRRCD